MDQVAHFAINIPKKLTDELHVNQHIRTALYPYSDGSVKTVNMEILPAFQVLLHKLRLPHNNWPAVSESFQSLLNHFHLQRLKLQDFERVQIHLALLEKILIFGLKWPLL